MLVISLDNSRPLRASSSLRVFVLTCLLDSTGNVQKTLDTMEHLRVKKTREHCPTNDINTNNKGKSYYLGAE